MNVSRKERVRHINIENNKDRLVEKWAEEASKNSEDDYVTKLLRHQEEGGLQHKKQSNTGDEERPCRKDRVRQINIATLQSELYSKDKKTDSRERVAPGFTPSFHKFVKVYIALFLFLIIFGFAVYVTDLKI